MSNRSTCTIALISVYVLISAVGADNECTPAHLIKLKVQLNEFFSCSDRGHLGVTIFKRFLERHPEAVRFFQHVGGDNIYSPKFKAHATRVLAGVNVNLNLLDDPETLHAQERHLKERHVKIGVPDEYMRGLIRSLNEEMSPAIGPCFDRDLWKNCARMFFGGMMTGITLTDSVSVPRPG